MKKNKITNPHLDRIITSQTRRQLLYFIFHKQTEPLSIRAISRQSKVNINSTVKEINSLIKANILLSKIQGHEKLVWVNKHHPLYPALYECLFKNYELGALLIKNFYNQDFIKFIIVTHFYLEHKPKQAYDFDVLFISDAKPDLEYVMKHIQDIEASLEKPIVYTLLKESEFLKRFKLFDSFVWKVFANKFIFIKGAFYELHTKSEQHLKNTIIKASTSNDIIGNIQPQYTQNNQNQ